jgi:hypothetical protein
MQRVMVFPECIVAELNDLRCLATLCSNVATYLRDEDIFGYISRSQTRVVKIGAAAQAKAGCRSDFHLGVVLKNALIGDTTGLV